MIEAKELRIGNYLHFKNTKDVAIVELIHKKQFACRDLENGSFSPHGSFSPIPLTEQWLLDFVFEYRTLTKDYFKPTGRKGSIFIFQNITAYICETNSKRQFLCNIEYLHQLQNLYFALTGEELTKK